MKDAFTFKLVRRLWQHRCWPHQLTQLSASKQWNKTQPVCEAWRTRSCLFACRRQKVCQEVVKNACEVQKKQNGKIWQPIKVKDYVIVDWLVTVPTDVIVRSPVHFPNNLKSHTIVPLKFVLKHLMNSSHIIYSYTSEWQIQWEQPDED